MHHRGTKWCMLRGLNRGNGRCKLAAAGRLDALRRFSVRPLSDVRARAFDVWQEGGETDKLLTAFVCIQDDGKPLVRATHEEKTSLAKAAKDGVMNIVDHLLPKDYKRSVGPNYLGYVKWTMAAGMVGTMSGVLSMQSLLAAVGLGAGAIPTAAALNWVLKDGLGQLGGVLFASVINQRFDAEPRRWRFKSAVILDLSILIEVLTPCFPQHFLLMATVANIGKNVGWLSASATRAGIHRSFMRVENLADITGKAGSQTIATSVVGTGLGIGLSSWVGADTSTIFMGAVALSALHLGCTYKALETVTIRSLNLQRAWLAIRPAIKHSFENEAVPSLCIETQRILRPEEVCKIEKILHLGKLSSRRHSVSILEQLDESFTNGRNKQPGLRIGPPVEVAFKTQGELVDAIDIALEMGEKHLLSVSREDSNINLLFLTDATSTDIYRGFLHAALTYKLLCLTGTEWHSNGSLVGTTRKYICEETLVRVMEELAQSGWDVENLFFEPFRTRIKVKAKNT